MFLIHRKMLFQIEEKKGKGQCSHFLLSNLFFLLENRLQVTVLIEYTPSSRHLKSPWLF